MKFSKSKMIARLIKEGKRESITDEVLKIMDDLDGQEAVISKWDKMIYGRISLVCTGKSGTVQPVHSDDTEP